MLEFEMVVENVDRFEQALKKFPEVASGELNEQIKYAAYKMITALQLYPPVPQGSTYQRTMALRDGWLKLGNYDFNHLSGFDFAYNVKNDVEYAGFVQGGKDDFPTQTAVHREHGWRTTDQVAEQFDGEFGKEAEKVLQSAYREVFEGW